MYKEGSKRRFQPKAIVDNVLEAVEHGMHREAAKKLEAKTASLSLNGEVNGEAIVDESLILARAGRYENGVGAFQLLHTIAGSWSF